MPTPRHRTETKRLSIDLPAHLHTRLKRLGGKGSITQTVEALIRAVPQKAVREILKSGTSPTFTITLKVD